MLEYDALIKGKSPPKDAHVNLACVLFYLGMYAEAEKAAEKAEKSQLKTRLRFKQFNGTNVRNCSTDFIFYLFRIDSTSPTSLETRRN